MEYKKKLAWVSSSCKLRFQAMVHYLRCEKKRCKGKYEKSHEIAMESLDNLTKLPHCIISSALYVQIAERYRVSSQKLAYLTDWATMIHLGVMRPWNMQGIMAKKQNIWQKNVHLLKWWNKMFFQRELCMEHLQLEPKACFILAASVSGAILMDSASGTTLAPVSESFPARANSYCQRLFCAKSRQVSEMQSARFFVSEPLKNWACCTGRKFYGLEPAWSVDR